VKKEELNRSIPAGGVPLAIIGIGCLFPRAEECTTYWANIREGVDAISEVPATHWQVADYFDQDPKSPDMTYGQRGGFLSAIPFNPMEFNIPPATLEAIDSSQLLGLVAAGQALKDAGYGPDRPFDRDRVSVILGVTGTLELVIPLGARLGHPHWRAALKDAGVDDATAADVVQRISDSYVPWQENSFPGLLGNVVAGRISKHFDLGGTNCVVDAACASSFSALHLAGMELATGKSDMVVTGGIDTFNDIFMYMCFSKTPALSPSGNAKPFDASGDGTILGEGLGIVVVKRLADAERDGDRIYAVIRGVGSSSDGRGEAIYTPSASGQKKAILDACQRAGVTPDSIGLVEAHGTGTKVGDAVEVSALREIYGEADRPWCALGSVKSQIGHTKASAGAAGLIKAALALHHRVIPPTIKVRQPLKEVTEGRTPFYIATEKRPWLAKGGAPRRAAVSAFGFGGSNFHTILEEYPLAGKSVDWDGNVQILAFSGSDAAVLEQSLSAFSGDIAWADLRARAAELRAAFDSAAPCRLALVVERGRTNLKTLLTTVQTMLRKNADTPWSSPDGAYFAAGHIAGKLGILFPGQGAQYTGMLRDLSCCFPEMLATLASADDGFEAPDGTRLSDLIYPATAFDPDGKIRQEESLRATDVAQPAIGAVSLGALRILESFGITAEAAAGHSYGELTALCAAGRLDEGSFHAISRLRGRLMAGGDGDKGSMLAVSAPLADVGRMLEEEGFDLVVANCNAPTQSVLSGSSAEIARAVTACGSRKITCKQLPVAAAFHSSLVADAAEPLHEALSDIRFAAGTIPVFSNTIAAEYPAAAAKAKKLLAGQLARPVEFVAEIEAMHVAGVRTFVEVGPGSRLSGLVSSILGEHKHTVVALDASGGKRSGVFDLARCLAQIAVLGHAVQLAKWDEGFHPPLQAGGKKPAMTIPLCGANYVKPRPRRPAAAQVRAAVQATASGNPVVAAPSTAVSQDALAESLRVTREGMSVLQRMQEETAQLHRRFLEGQEAASRTIQTLLEQQGRVLQGNTITTVQAASPESLSQTSQMSHGSPTTNTTHGTNRTTPPQSAHIITDTLLAVVAEKTGYPVEMLELEMGMDSDLGIDSIKRVEILSALQERLPGSPVIGPEHLGSLHTLGEIARHLGAGAAHTAPVLTSSAPAPTHEPSAVPGIGLTRSTIIPVALRENGDPISLAENGVIWVTDDGSRLSGEICSILSAADRDVRVVTVDEDLENLPMDDIAALVVIAPAAGTDDVFLQNAFLLLKRAAPALRRNAEAGGAVFCTVARLDGGFGCLAGSMIDDPLSGGLAGLAKTAAREWPEVACKAIDLGSFPDTTAAACALAGELFICGPAEVGLSSTGRTGLQLIDLPALPGPSSTPPVQAGDVVVVTGGGRGVTAATAIALAGAWRPLLVLIGRSPEPHPEPAWLAGLTDESAIKRAILEHAAEKLHPKEIEERYRAVVAGRELTGTMARIKDAGGSAIYRAVDIRDSRAVSDLLDSIRRDHGPIRGIVHGAGVLADRLIADKTREQFARVYGTKVEGLRSLLAATAADDLRFIALFGSTTGRLGRSGQVDYAVANEVLNKLAQTESRRRTSCRTVCINWGPWDGGMVTPALQKVFSDEGIGLIPLQAGGELLVREIAASKAPVEVVVLAESAITSLAAAPPAASARPLMEAFSLNLTVADYPFIRSHVIDGRAVLPMAMIVEWLAHGALHGNPGFRFHGFNDLRVCKGVVFDQDTACSLRVMAGRAEKRDSLYFVPVELCGASDDRHSLLHARAEIVLATRLPEGIRSIVDLPATPYSQGDDVIYDRERLFHGPDLQGIEQVGGCSAKGITALVKAAPQPARWIRQPLRNIWLTDPLVMDSAFQLMILWSFERFGFGSLPSFAGRYRQFQDSFPGEGAQIVIRVTAEREHGASADMEFLDRISGKLIARLEDYECVIDPSLQRAFRRNQLSQAGCVELEAA
jgi:acyl transferase domain-containing protein/NAD(P)-dependent dehydrogenase (short-subunit alcohol dehydrogenase family)